MTLLVSLAYPGPGTSQELNQLLSAGRLNKQYPCLGKRKLSSPFSLRKIQQHVLRRSEEKHHLWIIY